ncbi:MAG TPA: helix-turn-helix transcriptional regulator [Thermoanaerobaculia bacterium]
MARKSVVGSDCVAAADRYLSACFAAGTPPHVNELARDVDLSPRSLGRIFLAEAGVGVATYFKTARIRYAQDLLASTDLSLSAIADAAGFGTRATFFRAFKRATGVTPAAYRTGSNGR